MTISASATSPRARSSCTSAPRHRPRRPCGSRRPWGYEAYAATLDVSGLDAEAYELVRSFLLRAHTLTPGARLMIAGRLARPIGRLVHQLPPPDMPDELFLVLRRRGVPAAQLVDGREPAHVAVAVAASGRRAGAGAGARRWGAAARLPMTGVSRRRVEDRRLPFQGAGADLPRSRGDARRCDPRRSRRCCRSSPSTSATRRARTVLRARPARRSTRRASWWPSLLGVDPSEVVFTGGGTEADNLAVLGVPAARGGVAVCSAVEHHAVLHPVEHLGGRIVGGRQRTASSTSMLSPRRSTTACRSCR